MAKYSPNICPKCGVTEYVRIPRFWYMRLIPGTINNGCCQCGFTFISLFGIKLIRRRPLKSALKNRQDPLALSPHDIDIHSKANINSFS